MEQNQLKKLQMVQFECPEYRNPCVLSIIGPIPFSHFPLSGVIDNWTPQYESKKGGKLMEQNQLKKLQMVPFECPEYKTPVFRPLLGESLFQISLSLG